MDTVQFLQFIDLCGNIQKHLTLKADITLSEMSIVDVFCKEALT